MIINQNLRKDLLDLSNNINVIATNNNLTDLQLENFLHILEKTRYLLLSEIKAYNNNVQFEYEKIKTIDTDYKIEFNNDVLKIYIPEIMPSYKNIKTHTHKRILFNLAEITKPFSGLFNDEVFIYIKLFDKILGWDVDNKYIKPIADSLILSNVIKDDNMTKMSYCVKGEYSEIPHTEVYIFDSKNINNFLEKYIT